MIAPRAALLAAAALLVLSPLAAAKDVAPTPARLGAAADAAAALSPAERLIYTRAFEAADRGDWAAAKGLADQGQNRLARDLVLWRYDLAPDSGASFDEINAFLAANPDWPLRSALYRRAEHAMLGSMPAHRVIAWFGSRAPLTGIGMVRLGEALMATGQRAEGRALIRKGWIVGAFTPDEEKQVMAQCHDLLSAEVQHARLDRLIWHNDLAAARRQLNRVSRKEQRIAEVRLAFHTAPRRGELLLRRLPRAWHSNPGLLFDRARDLRAHGSKTALPDVLLRSSLRDLARIDPSVWWDNLALAARESMENHDYRLAYHLASDVGIKEGVDFAEAQFMAGWLALHFLHDPALALRHFRHLAAGVSRPISLARAHYWVGRAYEAEGQLQAAVQAYHLAAENPDTYYGQLALVRLDPDAKLRLPRTKSDPARIAASYEKDTMTRVIHILAQLDSGRFIRIFAEHDVALHPTPSYIAALATDLLHLGYRDAAVRAAKFASYRGIELPVYSHPIIALPTYRGPGTAPEDALVLALIRQETEFDSTAVSGAGARGLMQLMPASAKQLAKALGMAWKPQQLGSNETYNMQLGMTELAQHLHEWDGSYILAAAGYNAGDTNVRRWIKIFGDPRTAAVDPIDWIEMIPFSETRNYVQRILESTQIYRDRLAGKSEPLGILADLYRPDAPPTQRVLPPLAAAGDVPVPKTRPRQAAIAADTQTAALGAGPSATAPASIITPTMRPKSIPSVQ